MTPKNMQHFAPQILCHLARSEKCHIDLDVDRLVNTAKKDNDKENTIGTLSLTGKNGAVWDQQTKLEFWHVSDGSQRW